MKMKEIGPTGGARDACIPLGSANDNDFSVLLFKIRYKQESILVGCVPTAP